MFFTFLLFTSYRVVECRRFTIVNNFFNQFIFPTNTFKKCFFNKGVEIALEQLMRQLDTDDIRPDELVAYLVGKSVNVTIYDNTWYDAAAGVERHEKAVAFTATEYKPKDVADNSAMV